ncbi:exosome RNA helicase MTR4 [Parasteatoda tepidariorum]|uniref:exosome RNA helicase MTR4 n=1 Tax=Parasteatoda tepidariorum TaxID=114398 RepID=UPI001C71EB2D|nr:exosome RNA helicase MTR4 [Parasteatoda tepidariorum]
MDDNDDLFSVFDDESDKNTKKSDLVTVKTEKEPQIVCDFLKEIAEGKRIHEEESNVETKKLKTNNILDTINLDEFSRIQIHVVETVEACLHEVAVPPDSDYMPLRQSQNPPSRNYPFLLDPFQKEAILCLENNQSVLVSAHTSAGKTVVAEYAIATSLKNKQRVIYTTPIKALSNQKYREFFEEFKDVGLLTGDATINPSASCLIMTTEILRSMLYRGSEVMREVGWVIFDEIHYMRDKERGVVWEETIILLPDSVHYVFLSATIPNARQFAEWICYLHHQPCHVVYTDYRPVPLQQYIFPAGGDGLHLVVDESGNFREENFNTAMNVLQVVGGASKGDSAMRGRKGGMKDGSNCYKIVKMIMERNFAPVIVFSFSKKECEAYAMQMAKLDFNSAEEKPLVEEVFKNAMDVLSDEDKKLPQVEHVLPLLKRGIGIHHSGLLPILKETIEILFSEGLIKVILSFHSIPTHSPYILFKIIHKILFYSSTQLTSGEYIQMSGRAGRRGLDERGIVILMVDEKMSPSAGKDIVKGLPDPINSAFHLTYNMVLNLLRVDEINPEYMLERSFFQFQNYSAIPQLYDRIRKLEENHDNILIKKEEEVDTYYKIQKQLSALSAEYHSYIIQPEYCVPFFQPGRLVRVQNGEQDFGWGMIINYQKKSSENKQDSLVIYVVDVLLQVSKDSVDSKVTSSIKPVEKGEKGVMQVVPVKLDLIQQFSSVRAYTPQDLRPLDNRMQVLKTIQTIQERFPDGLPLLDPVKDMKIKDQGFKDVLKKIEAFNLRLNQHSLHNNPDVHDYISQYKRKAEIHSELKEAKAELKKAQSLLQMDELKCRKRVLRRMGYCTASDVIELKGRVACEISSADELILTEMIFNGVFNNLDVHQTTSLLSCFVFQEKSNEMPKLTEELSGPLRLMQETARRIAKISKECKLELDSENYVESFRPHLMDVVSSWSKGASFLQISKMTDVFEGSVIRCMRRLEELLRQMCQAAKAIGNTELEKKFSDGIKLIKRDIVFAASLYL